MSVWDDLVGQSAAVDVLRRAVAGAATHAMSHAWLITGPPGSGRSNAARAFAAALQCERGGCGVCLACTTALSGAHPDVTLVRTERLSIGVDEVRDLVRRAAMSPTNGRSQVLVVEDADRITEQGANALLKSIEEPAPRTVWLLCAPSADDVSATVRSRCRLLHLTTPQPRDVAALLERRDGIDPATAAFAARAAQGHIGRARRLARDEAARARRREALEVVGRLTSVASCLSAAADLLRSSTEEAEAITEELDARELASLRETMGAGPGTRRNDRATTAAVKALTEEQRVRAKRLQRDALDRALTELTILHRDVLSVQLGADAELVASDMEAEVRRVAAASSPESTLRRIDAVLACRDALEANVAPLVALEAMTLSLARG